MSLKNNDQSVDLSVIGKGIQELKEQNRKLVLTNFRLGKLIGDFAEENNVDPVDLINQLYGKDRNISPPHLLDCLRVYRKFRNEKFLERVIDTLGGYTTWSFIVNNMLSAPEGETKEAILYWESQIEKAEKLFYSVESLFLENFNKIPESVKSQIRGLLISLGYRAPEEYSFQSSDVRIAQITDIHISEKLTSAGKLIINPKTGRNKRLESIQRCLSYAVSKAIEYKCDLALISEPFDRYNPTPNEIDVFMTEIRKLADYMPVIVEPGNHGIDRNRKNASVFSFLKGQHNIYYTDTPKTYYFFEGLVFETPPERFAAKYGRSALVHVLPYPIRYTSSNMSKQEVEKTLVSIVESFSSTNTWRVPSILLAHITVAGARKSEVIAEVEPVISPESLSKFDYVAVGHLHTFQQIGKNIFYAGSIERLDFDEEGEQKGFIIATLSLDDRDIKTEFIPTPATEMKTISVEDLKSGKIPEFENGEIMCRIVGKISSAEKEQIKEKILSIQKQLPTLVKIQVETGRTTTSLAEKITDALGDEQAIVEFLKSHGVRFELIEEVLKYHREIVSSTN